MKGKHRLTMAIEGIESDVLLALKTVGKLTHTDYELITLMNQRFHR
ncbi:hypothetical protein [Colwellia chukchiensis]|nr:hypothetical protein [Colwellia chukchiensis]